MLFCWDAIDLAPADETMPSWVHLIMFLLFLLAVACFVLVPCQGCLQGCQGMKVTFRS